MVTEVVAEVEFIRELQEQIRMADVDSAGSRAPNRPSPIDQIVATGLAEAKAHSDRLNRFALAT